MSRACQGHVKGMSRAHVKINKQPQNTTELCTPDLRRAISEWMMDALNKCPVRTPPSTPVLQRPILKPLASRWESHESQRNPAEVHVHSQQPPKKP
mmetsp:Transcript_5636/g.12996  ORF Transcript_5636/g.12996 Transcript_5636/m.12996 type:complete len:96 (-) Transcript_5636:864-1151(-)